MFKTETDITVTFGIYEVLDLNQQEVMVRDAWFDNDNDLRIELNTYTVNKDQAELLDHLANIGIDSIESFTRMMGFLPTKEP